MPEELKSIGVDLGELSKPADTFIKKVSKAIGTLYRPRHIIKIATAEAEANIIKTKSEIEVAELKRRAMARLEEEEIRHQLNMESITAKAIPLLADASDASKIEDEWMANFFEKCRNISSEEMQQLWAKILAGEANAPGKYSRRTVNFLHDFNKKEAESFTLLCSFGFGVTQRIPVIIGETKYYDEKGLDYNKLLHLESISLIKIEDTQKFTIVLRTPEIVMEYFGRSFPLNVRSLELRVGKVALTPLGNELAPISGAKEVEGFFERIKAMWESMPINEAVTPKFEVKKP